jgi:hypothetical protein
LVPIDKLYTFGLKLKTMEQQYQSAINKLKEEYDKAIKMAEGYKISIDALESNGSTQNSNAVSKSIEINSVLTSAEKDVLVYETLDHLKRFSKIGDIGKALAGKMAEADVRASITTLAKSKQIMKVQVTTSNVDTYWGLIYWQNTGTIKEEFMYDKKTLVGKTMKKG